MKLPVFLVCAVGVAVVSFGTGHFSAAGLAGLAGNSGVLPGKPASAPIQIDEVAVEIPDADGTPNRIAVARHEVTFGEWQACVEASACSYSPVRRRYVEDNHPVSGVSWHDVQQYIAWRSSEDGVRYRLPLENEWRALAVNVLDETVDKLFDDPRLSWAADYANFSKRAERATKPVGSFGAEENGVADIAGNVWEWTASCWRNPTTATTGGRNQNCGGVRVLAGVHMTYQSELIRVVPTGGCSIGFPPANIGFRMVRDLGPDEKQTEPVTYRFAKQGA